MIEFDNKLSKLLDDLLESLSAVKDASVFILKFITENNQMRRYIKLQSNFNALQILTVLEL